MEQEQMGLQKKKADHSVILQVFYGETVTHKSSQHPQLSGL